MREIEFRGQEIRTNKWIYGFYCLKEPDEDGGIHYIYNEDDGRCFTPIYSETIGQYTGLKDKNGKKIFEGDIVKVFCDCDGFFVESKYIYGKVCFSKEFLDYEINYDHIRYGCDESLCNRSDDIEVVGNIYDDKDLLEVKE